MSRELGAFLGFPVFSHHSVRTQPRLGSCAACTRTLRTSTHVSCCNIGRRIAYFRATSLLFLAFAAFPDNPSTAGFYTRLIEAPRICYTLIEQSCTHASPACPCSSAMYAGFRSIPRHLCFAIDTMLRVPRMPGHARYKMSALILAPVNWITARRAIGSIGYTAKRMYGC